VKWHTRDSSEGEEGNAPTIFRDIYQGDERIATRVDFEQAERIVVSHNDKVTNQYAESLDEMSDDLKKLSKFNALAPETLAIIFRNEAKRVRNT
jgi:hypothetical protein